MLAWSLWAWSLAAEPTAAARKADNAVIIHQISAEEARALWAEVGQHSQIERDEVGDPMLRTQRGGEPFVVLFYDCQDHTACRAMQFRALVSRPKSSNTTLAQDWNRSRRFGRAYVDAVGALVYERFVLLEGGVAPEHLRAERDAWLSGLDMLMGAASALP